MAAACAVVDVAMLLFNGNQCFLDTVAIDAFLNASRSRSVDCIDFVMVDLGYKVNSSKHWFILYYQRVLLTLSELSFFSGVRIGRRIL